MKCKLLISTMVFSALFSACSVEDNSAGSSETNEAQAIAFEKVQRDSCHQAYLYESAVTNCFFTDTLPSGSVQFTPRYGREVQSLSTEYYFVPSVAASDAADVFEQIVPVGGTDEVEISGDTKTFSTKGFTMTCKGGEEAGEVARIEIACDACPQFKGFSFMSPDALPMKANPGMQGEDNRIPLASIWKNGNYYYICVKEAGTDGYGILLTFDGGWGYWSGKHGHYDGWFGSCKHTYDNLRTGLASKGDINRLANLYSYYETSLKEAALDLWLYRLKNKLGEYFSNTYQAIVNEVFSHSDWYNIETLGDLYEAIDKYSRHNVNDVIDGQMFHVGIFCGGHEFDQNCNKDATWFKHDRATITRNGGTATVNFEQPWCGYLNHNNGKYWNGDYDSGYYNSLFAVSKSFSYSDNPITWGWAQIH